MIQDFPLFVKNVQVNCWLRRRLRRSQPRDLDLATERMMATSLSGVVDCFDQSVAAGAHALRKRLPELDATRPAVNVPRTGWWAPWPARTENLRQACTPEVYESAAANALEPPAVDRARAECCAASRRSHSGGPAAPSTAAAPAQPSAGFFTIARRLVSLAPYWRQLDRQRAEDTFRRRIYGKLAAPLLAAGAYQGRQPHPCRPRVHLRKYPDVAAAASNPLCHTWKHGRRGMTPAASHAYRYRSVSLRRRNPDIRRARIR